MSAGRPPKPWPGSCAGIATSSEPARTPGPWASSSRPCSCCDGSPTAHACPNSPGTTGYRSLHEGLTLLADQAPDLSTALERAAAAGYSHLNLDGTVIRTDRVAAPCPNKADLCWSGKHKHHRGNVQVISTPDGWPIWVSPVRPGREHDTTCARAHGLIAALNRLAAILDIPTLTDLGYENASPGFRHPVKKPQGRELTTRQKTFNRVIRAIHGVAERANAPLKVTFKALRRGSLDPGSITWIARAALVLLQLETGVTT
ncbi:hypothetical protein GCM10022403_019400 [Streptomyces coacervatus]|uniref:DDE Tnp4 domain-containing protein n=1 Tax=Streptomyces coacervatus TaxID=647381 RepID=A0ABP7H511_9ACTN